MTAGAALATFFLLAAANVVAVRGEHSARYFNLVAEPGLRGGTAFALALLVLPVAGFLYQSSRLAAATRDRRLAALRLAGATPRQVRLLGAYESTLASAVGAVVGLAGYLLLQMLGRAVLPEDRPIVPVDVGLPPPLAGAAVALVVAAGTISGLLAGRHVITSPLGVARRAQSPRPRAWGLAPRARRGVGHRRPVRAARAGLGSGGDRRPVRRGRARRRRAHAVGELGRVANRPSRGRAGPHRRVAARRTDNRGRPAGLGAGAGRGRARRAGRQRGRLDGGGSIRARAPQRGLLCGELSPRRPRAGLRDGGRGRRARRPPGGVAAGASARSRGAGRGRTAVPGVAPGGHQGGAARRGPGVRAGRHHRRPAPAVGTGGHRNRRGVGARPGRAPRGVRRPRHGARRAGDRTAAAPGGVGGGAALRVSRRAGEALRPNKARRRCAPWPFRFPPPRTRMVRAA
ncbi:MAG: FtsX-like permease family protein [Streptosporangiales bacterium]|nr:FtsX-like permease family protein [Streptosporangiales bacterium]